MHCLSLSLQKMLMMDVFLTIIGFLCVIIGIVGCILPVLPGPSISFIGLLLLHWTSFTQYNTWTLVLLGVATLIVTILDQILPVWMTKKSGGSKYGIWGSSLGIIAGCFLFPPVGIIIFPFVGAFIGELLYGKKTQHAFKAAWGSFLGFLTGIGIKLILVGIISFYFFKSLWGLISGF